MIIRYVEVDYRRVYTGSCIALIREAEGEGALQVGIIVICGVESRFLLDICGTQHNNE